MKKVWLLLTLAGAVLLSAGPVGADDGFYVIAAHGGAGTRITSLPYNITHAGFYYLTGNLTYTGGVGITVNSDNVTLDLMGFCLQGGYNGGSPVGHYTGIDITARNVEIRNGSLRRWAIAVDAHYNNTRITGVRALYCYEGFLFHQWSNLIEGCTASSNTDFGISVNGGAATIKNNMVVSNPNKGIAVNGYAEVIGNTVSYSNTAISFMATGSIIGNTVNCDSGQTGFFLSTDASQPILMDQNVVHGDGQRVSGGGTNVVYRTNGF
jgi:parallel beta-helix repeat protein